MPMGELSDEAAKLREALQSLGILWQETKADWNDQACRRFEQEFLLPLDHDAKQGLEGMGRLTQILIQAHAGLKE